jgi:diaminopimelate epimerase
MLILFVAHPKRREDETLACGTGATAAAIAMEQNLTPLGIDLNVEGGKLVVFSQ